MEPMDALEAIRRAGAARWASLPCGGSMGARLRSSRGFAAFIEAHSNRPKPVSFGEGAEGHSQTAYDLLRISAWALVIIGALPVIVGLIGNRGAPTNRAAQDQCTVSKTALQRATFSRMESIEAVQTTEPAARSLAPGAARSPLLRSRPSRGPRRRSWCEAATGPCGAGCLLARPGPGRRQAARTAARPQEQARLK
jgi:hypothetical protein